MRWLVLNLSYVLLAAGPPLENTGKPMRVPFQCSEEDVEAYGLTCTAEDPCPVYVELAGLETAGNKIFLAGNFHTAAATFASLLLTSEDAGKTWVEPYDRIRNAGLEQVQFLDFESGWVGGEILLNLPRDPFLLLTNDGGKTWRRRPILGEPGVGAIQRFSFESKTAGTLLLDRMQSGESGGRHALYETMTGGETWMLREVSQRPLALKQTKAPNDDWRMRADRATKSYRVERREAGRWRTVASFLVDAGECKIKEKELVPPPDPEAQPQTPPPSPPPAAPRKPPTLKKKP